MYKKGGSVALSLSDRLLFIVFLGRALFSGGVFWERIAAGAYIPIVAMPLRNKTLM